jgi:hypothetical protein
VLTFGRPPVTGSVAENRAAPDSLAHTADPTQVQNGKAGPATAKAPVAGPAPWRSTPSMALSQDAPRCESSGWATPAPAPQSSISGSAKNPGRWTRYRRRRWALGVAARVGQQGDSRGVGRACAAARWFGDGERPPSASRGEPFGVPARGLPPAAPPPPPRHRRGRPQTSASHA